MVRLLLTALLLFYSLTSAFAQTARFQLPPPKDTAEARRFAFFAYDPNLPLNVTQKVKEDTATRTRYLLAFDSAHDQRVPALLTVPKTHRASHPAVILVHGSGGHKESSYIVFIGDQLVKAGFITLSIDTQYHGDRAKKGVSSEIHMPDSYRMRDAWVQSVIDLRRCVDYLQSRSDVLADKIGYMGFSQGAMLGSVLGGVEGRIACFCLAVPGGGLLDIVNNMEKYPVIKAHWPLKKTPEIMKIIEEVVDITDPIYYVGRILPRPLLVIVANHDEIIPPEASKALLAAAGVDEQQNVQRWESGHVIPPVAVFTIKAFFVKHFGEQTPK